MSRSDATWAQPPLGAVPAAKSAAGARIAANAACFHCGEALPAGGTARTGSQAAAVAIIDGRERAFCCAGCAAAARWIEDADLQDYYRLRQRDAARIEADDTDFSAWDRDDVLAGHTRTLDDGAREITVLTDGMRCAACAWLIDRALCQHSGVREVVANAVTGRIRVVWDPQRTRLSSLLSRLAQLGYRPALANGHAHEAARRRERRRGLIRWGVAGLGTMQAMMFAEALYLDTARQMPIPTRDFFRWIAFLVSTPVVFFAGWPFLEGLWRELRARRLGMDSLIASSTLLAYFASVLETLRGGVHVWYDAAVMFVFLLLTARLLDARARSAASAQVDALARARPALATRETADGRREHVPLAALRIGDVVRVAVGEAVPADGVVLESCRPSESMPSSRASSTAFDESLLSGESRPVEKFPGDAVYAGSLCRESPARLRVTRIGEDTRLSQLTRLVERAQAQRPALARAADRVAAWFVLALALTAAAVYLWWRWHEPARAFEVALAVLVVSCPCALSLAVPTALTAVHGALAKLGVLALRPEALPALARADRIVFDKTGTLSDRRPRIAAIEAFGCADDNAIDGARAPTRGMHSNGMHPNGIRSNSMHSKGLRSNAQALAIACALERDSGHPLAAAFLAAQAMADTPHNAETMQANDVRSVPGDGIAGRVEGIEYRLGRSAWAAAGDARARDDDDALWLGDGERALARFRVEETPREDAADTLRALRALGLRVEICSGDARARVLRLARALGVAEDAAHGRCTPEDKLAQVRAHQAAGAVVAMVGDGLNDAPVLAGADVSLALADGAALAQRAADFVVVGDALAKIPQAVALARRSGRIVRQNLAWAIGYNLLALPLAAAGLVTPWMAAVGMALSSLLVTLNALRLARVPAAHTGAQPSDHVALGGRDQMRERSAAAPAQATAGRLSAPERAP